MMVITVIMGGRRVASACGREGELRVASCERVWCVFDYFDMWVREKGAQRERGRCEGMTMG